MKRIAVFCFALSAIALAMILVAIPRIRADAQAKLDVLLIREPFIKVKRGDPRVNVMRSELLELLAGDEQCTKNLREINFANVEFESTDAEFLAKLENLTTVNFYCCSNADSILSACTKLPIASISFELTNFSPESVEQLGAIPTLTSFIVEQKLDRFQVTAIKLLPKAVTVRSSFPMDAYD
jgi:hypothetical protein